MITFTVDLSFNEMGLKTYGMVEGCSRVVHSLDVPDMDPSGLSCSEPVPGDPSNSAGPRSTYTSLIQIT